MASFILAVNGDRLNARLKSLGEVGALPGGGVCRLALTDEDRQGRDLVVSWMRELGLEIAIDAIGNVVATLKGEENLPAVMMGSHIDTVSTAGLFDGNLGVLAGLEVIETIIESGINPKHSISVGFFTNEEGSRFAPDMMGSGVYTGDLPLATALQTVGIDGKSVADELNRIGYSGKAPFPNISETVAAYFELHVEQGPVLDEENIEIGVVEGVQGISWHEYTFYGNSNHAGTTPMAYRNDAGLVAAKINVFANELALSIPSQLATVGALEIKPNLVNVIPAFARFTVDLRNCDEALLQSAESRLDTYITEQTERHGLTFEKRKLARFEPVPFNKHLVDGIEASAMENDLTSKRLYSGAGHDAQMFAPHCPTTMIFVPSVGGISHNIKEYTTPEQVTNGANVLLQAVLNVAKIL
ncbi:M20 family metallo-hydrolase [Reinekea marinisedimentorum]|uniref:N-carbamoyl-L-amino-acid hydrolase n=1 Tax=Reinekea marinisedimentorum TaxID=230495 RepID=A0A4R3HRC9_9GAMM|nr:M20 family metallo-hydrolase [Reinekea marinisedimentorum]TCS35666.1 N-carbamoyl-L-amino-acid hydrolase [Reinekea marinisedimentorum]